MKELGNQESTFRIYSRIPSKNLKVAAGGTTESSIENLKQNLFKICDSIRIKKAVTENS